MDNENTNEYSLKNGEPNSDELATKNNSRKILIYVGILVFTLFFVGIAYITLVPTENRVGNSEENPSIIQTKDQNSPSPDVALQTNDDKEPGMSSFQVFLKQNCVGKQASYGFEYNVPLAQIPFVLSEKTKIAYHLTDQIGCFFSTDSSSIESGKGYLFATKSRDNSNNSFNKSQLKLGDINSATFGFEAHYLDYDKEIKENKQTLIYDKDGIKIVARGIFAGPYCPNDQNFWFELIAFKSLGEYRISISSDYMLDKNPELDTLIQRYGKPVVENDLNEANYEICGDATEYEKAVLSKFLPSYENAEANLKTLMSEMITDLQQTTLR